MKEEKPKCISGKREFPSLIAANRELLRCWRKGREEREVYRCKACGAYHLTRARRFRAAKPDEFPLITEKDHSPTRADK